MSFNFFGVIIAGCVSILRLSKAVRGARTKEDGFGKGGFSVSAVSHERYIPYIFRFILHNKAPFILYLTGHAYKNMNGRSIFSHNASVSGGF